MRFPPGSLSSTIHRAEVSPGLWLDSRFALWIPAERILALADLHWGYSASHRARGNLLPMWGDDDIESRLNALIADYAPAEMIWLGDIVHAAEGAARVEQFLRQTSVRITLIAGNHDRRWRGIYGINEFQPPVFSLQRGAFLFHHGDRKPRVDPGVIEILGHHHPAVSWGDNAGSRVKLRALVARSNRLILPAFSPWAAGTPWNDQLTPEDTLWVIAPNRIFALPRPARAPVPVAG